VGMTTQWHGIALDKQVQAALSNPVIVQGEQLAMWRAERSGTVQVWEDRCPHRGMRLSFGYVRSDAHGDVLHCIYHSWGFRVDGQCVDIPAHPGVAPPKSLGAKPYPVHMRYGIVWTNLQRSESAPPPDFDCPPDGWEPVRSLYVKAGAERLMDVLKNFDFGMPAHVTHQQANGLRLALNDGFELLLAMQAVANEHTGLHAVLRATNNTDDTTRIRLALAKRLQRLRAVVEHAAN